MNVRKLLTVALSVSSMSVSVPSLASGQSLDKLTLAPVIHVSDNELRMYAAKFLELNHKIKQPDVDVNAIDQNNYYFFSALNLLEGRKINVQLLPFAEGEILRALAMVKTSSDSCFIQDLEFGSVGRVVLSFHNESIKVDGFSKFDCFLGSIRHFYNLALPENKTLPTEISTLNLLLGE